MATGALRGWTGAQKHVVAASYLGWTLDAFDFFILVFTLSAPVAVPCVYNLNQSFYNGNLAMGQWMAKALGGKGSIFVDQGVAGLSISQQIEKGFLTGMKKYGPGSVRS